MPDKYSLLKRYWGYSGFRPLQEQIVDAVASGRDTLVLLPTGGGKSLCYQLPALMREGLCLVVSPLIALMKDQVQSLNDRKLRAACLVSGMAADEATSVLYNAISGGIKFLFVSPERLLNRRFVEHLRQMRLCLIAVDEAHCISQWGYDFRPPYLRVAEVRALHPGVPLVALTATATPAVAEDVRQKLQMRDGLTFQSSFYRNNLAYRVERCSDKVPRLAQLIQTAGGSAIVYVRSRKLTKMVADALTSRGIGALSYHAGLDTSERDARQRMWTENQCRVIVATNAFGMGIDKPDVRLVAHIDVPDSLEAYFQEAGRAGRDGKPAQAVLLCDEADLERCRRNLDDDFPPLRFVQNIYRALCNYYKIPMGSGADTAYDFDLAAVCSEYNLDPRRFYSACRFLEREGLIALPDREDTSSQLLVVMRRDELYRLQVDHQRMGMVMLAVVRMYGSVFTESTPIDEEKIARRAMMSASDVRALLKQMHEMHVVTYRQRPTKPQILFTCERVDEKSIAFRESSFAQLKEAAGRRLDAMLDYVADGDLCRSQRLLAYFGEAGSCRCGVCDVCLKASQNGGELRKAIVGTLQGGPMPAADLVRLLKSEGYVGVGECLRDLLDESVLLINADRVLTLCR
ncbi:MAG: RecQ family ATP-dependent DNA helicase [Bacteroidales bacterium]|nr:RecQ family ATP-dependent DNA helicase [Bacteroidales bacterium]